MKSLLLFISAVLFWSCSESKSPNSEDLLEEFQLKGSIAGVVTDLNNQPISGVAATLDEAGYDTQSDKDGQYTIPSVPQGAYSITFTHTLYHDTTVHNVAILEDEDLVITNVRMRPKTNTLNQGFIKGSIIDSASGSGLQGVQIDAGGQGSTTDSSGAFLLSQIDPGQYLITIVRSGCTSPTLDSIIVAAKDTLDLGEIQMTCTFNLDDLGFIKGVVVDSATGNGIPGVVVSTQTGMTDASSADGSFLIAQVEAGDHLVSLTSDVYTNLTDIAVKVTALDTVDMGTLEMSPSDFGPTGHISGSVDASVPSNIAIIATPSVGTGTTGNAITDGQGEFSIQNLSVGTYYVQATGAYTSDIDTIEVLEDQTIIVNLVNVVPDQNKLPRTVQGELTQGRKYGNLNSSLTSLDSIVVEINRDGESQVETTQLGYNSSNGNYSGTFYIPDVDVTWRATIKGFSSTGEVIFYSTQLFDRQAGDLTFPIDDVWNAIPRLEGYIVATFNPEVSINDTIKLYPQITNGVDDLVMPTLKWKAEGDLTWTDMTTQDFVFAPASEDNSFEVQIRATDASGNQVTKSYYTAVISDPPTVQWESPITGGVGLNNTFNVQGIDKYSASFTFEWSTDGVNYSTGGASKEFNWPTKGAHLVYAKVIDDDGLETIDSIKFLVQDYFVDSRDSEIYTYTSVGSQVWMTQNLRFDPGGGWNSVCIEGEDDCLKNGRFYQTTAMMQMSDFSGYNGNAGADIQGVCPSGWHIPSQVEWQSLKTYIASMSGEQYTEAQYLKATTGGWEANAVYDNSYGFSATASGMFRLWNGNLYSTLGTEVKFWTSTNSSIGAWSFKAYDMDNSSENLTEVSISNDYLPLRCIQD